LRAAKKTELGLKSVEELGQISNLKQRDEENQAQLFLRARYRFEILSKIRKIIHSKENERKPKAICFSGGGIRSATFGLGVIQGLAKYGLLDKFDYLSTVSGGGYIGSWLTAWIYQTRVKAKEETDNEKDFSIKYVRKVQEEIKKKNCGEVEPIEVSHLRAYSNYMSPLVGLFSTDTWGLIGVFIRNLLLNWTVFVPLIAAFLLLPKLFLTVMNFGYSGEYLFLLWVIVTFAGCVAVSNITAMRPSLSKFSWIKQNYKIDDIGEVINAESKVLKWCLIPLLILSAGITVYWAWLPEQNISFPLSEKLPDFLKSVDIKFIYFVLFSEILFVGGFILTRLIIWFREHKNNSDGIWENVLKEFFISGFCGIFGGSILYWVIQNLSTMASPVNRIFPDTDANTLYVCFGAPLFLIIFLLSATVFIGIASKINDDMDREWMTRFSGLLLKIIVGWIVISNIVLFGPKLFDQTKFEWIKGGVLASVGGISGLITLFLGFSRKSPAKTNEGPQSKASFLAWFAPQIAAPIFAVFLMILITFGTNSLMSYTEIFNPWIWFGIFTGVGCLMGWWININKFSLHATYRERLIRAYLGASRTKERLKTANSFTGLDNCDNIAMDELRQKPLHVVNMTLNLVKTTNLRWQNRKAESFTATALHSGSSTMGDGSGGYRNSDVYGYNEQSRHAITLGTSAAISGAAASPNMGYYSMSTAVSFLMTLFNVRLGWWLGNPGKRGDNTYHLSAPRWSPRLFFNEALGGTDDTHPYVYLSDGGHFDNLGLYEMVLRRCHFIVVCDAGADSEFGFSDFGTAIHKIRVDMGIPIVFSREKAPLQGRNCGVARIKYSEVDGENVKDGFLIYIKPTLDGDEPIDLVNYKKAHPDFPHESTADQMYSESQFESYRSLGFHMINSICGGDSESDCGTLSDLKNCADKYLERCNRKGKEDDRKIRLQTP
jgi:Patatin-like phospholipase